MQPGIVKKLVKGYMLGYYTVLYCISYYTVFRIILYFVLYCISYYTVFWVTVLV